MRATSKYFGVYFKKTYKKTKSGTYSHVFWCAKFERAGHPKFLKHFEFSDEGELLAAEAITTFLRKHKIKPEYYKQRRTFPS